MPRGLYNPGVQPECNKSTGSGTDRSPEVWTTRALLSWMIEHFESKSIDSPRVVAELLLAHVFGCARIRLYMETDRPASNAERDALRELVRRVAVGEPVQYLTGRTSFFGREFLVDRSTMIPQPCTEGLVEAALESIGSPRKTPVRVADVGTGTGCVIISLALQLPNAACVASDIAPGALDLARRNAALHKVESRISFREGSLLEPIRNIRAEDVFDAICANLPYISDSEWDGGEVERSVRENVPARALRGGSDGLDFIRAMISRSHELLRPRGLLALEIGHAHRDEVERLLAEHGAYERVNIARDGDGLWRIATARRK